jgi:UPF0716 protein FxsA
MLILHHPVGARPVRLGQILFLLFLIVPILEIYLLIQVGGLIGALPTVALVVLTAVLGSMLLRHQGLATLRQAQAGLEQGIPPAKPLLDAVFLVIGGALLLTPGFVTDAFGFVCLLPPGRAWLVGLAMSRMHVISAAGAEDPGAASRSPGPDRRRPSGHRTIDGEWRREDD